MMFGLQQVPQYVWVWSRDDLKCVPQIADAMAKTRYHMKIVSTFFHLNDNSAQQPDKTHQDYHPIFKVRSVIFEKFQEILLTCSKL